MTNSAIATGLTNPAPHSARERGAGMALVFLSALFWSFGGAIERFIDAPDVWTVVFWRASWAAVSILLFLLLRDGGAATLNAFRSMRLPGLVVALCFATASTSFVVALTYTSVANIMLIQASVPLLAALFGWVFFRERVSVPTWVAIAAVIAGVAIMVSDGFNNKISMIGDGLAVLIACVFATATVVTRRYAHVRMTPAGCLGAAISAIVAATQASTLATGLADSLWLFAFGALNLGLGMVLFATGARLIPAAYAALIGCAEPVLGPLWVWLVHDEDPSARALIGGSIVVLALMTHMLLQLRDERKHAS